MILEVSAYRPDPSEQVGVIVVGTGYWGINYVRVLSELPQARVIGAADPSIERLRTVGTSTPDVTLATDLDELLALPGIDAAVICTPASTHRAVATRCIEAGLHVLVEKPLTTSAADADALVRCADRQQRILMTGHTFLFNNAVAKVKEYVAAGELGRPFYLYARRTGLGPIRSDVDAVWDLAPHDISIFNHLIDAQPEWVSAIGSHVLPHGHVDVAFITLAYPGEVLAHVHVSWVDPSKTRQLVVVGSKRRILFNDLDPGERVRVFEKGVEPQPAEAPTFGEYTFLLRDGDIVSPLVEAGEPLKQQSAHFLDCVRSGRRPQSDGRSGRNVVRIVEAVEKSMQFHGSPVPVALPRRGKRFAREGAGAAVSHPVP